MFQYEIAAIQLPGVPNMRVISKSSVFLYTLPI